MCFTHICCFIPQFFLQGSYINLQNHESKIARYT
nr:MAG TPA: Protealysin propeptide [Crassvirales sp.]